MRDDTTRSSRSVEECERLPAHMKKQRRSSTSLSESVGTSGTTDQRAFPLDQMQKREEWLPAGSVGRLATGTILSDYGAVGESLVGMASDEFITMSPRLGRKSFELLVAQGRVELELQLT